MVQLNTGDCVTDSRYIYLLVYTVVNQDATANDIPKGEFDIKGFPTLYFKSASGNISQYEGDRTKEAIIEFIEKNRDKPAAHHSESSVKADSTKPESVTTDSAKDEL